jgi:nucleosome binding factor SPN SPT16 subunit
MGEELKINAETFYEKLDKLVHHWQSQKSSLWGSADALCIPYGSRQEGTYSKTQAFHLYFFGIEDLSDSIILLTKTEFYFMSNAKKCNFLRDQLSSSEKKSDKIVNFHYLEKTKDNGMVRENFNRLMGSVRKGGGKSMGSFYSDNFEGSFIPMWSEFVEGSQIEKVDVANAFGMFFAIKDEEEVELCRRAAILTNKILKHSFVDSLDSIIEEKQTKSHDDLTKQLEETITDPSKIGMKVTASVDICYTPIVQSGGDYNIKLSASSSKGNLSFNVILCSLGARYKHYCATMSRTYLVNPPKKVEQCYETLNKLFHHCLEQMITGNEMKTVYLKAKEYLTQKNPELLSYLTKSLGFSMGIEFRDPTLVLNQTNDKKFVPGMVFNLSVGFSNIPLESKEKEGKKDYQKLNVFSLVISDVVVIKADGGVPDILTKAGKELEDVVYGDEEGEEGGDGEEDGGEEDDGEEDGSASGPGIRTRGSRTRANDEAKESARYQRQKELILRRNEEGMRRMKKGGADDGGAEEETIAEAKDLKTYKAAQEMPRDLVPNRLKVDMEHEALIIPLNGRHVPFHATTVKNMNLTEGELRINFYTSGAALGKDAPKNIQSLVMKYGPTCTFIKELTFRSADDKNLSTVHQQFQELRRRIRQREQKAEQEKDLVVQANLIRIRDQKIARLSDVSMRPVISGRKSQGTLEAHQNGLRFTSSKGEIADVMYQNIKHLVFQPCEKTAMVLIHFHLKDAILIGKKKVSDVQFFTELVEASENLDGHRHSGYDPDEIEDEKRQRDLQKRMNAVFKDFCGKVEKVAEHFNFNVKADPTFKKTSFQGNWGRDMVTFMATTNCLVSLTEWPTFLITLSEVEHCHLERVSYGCRNFDIVFIFKDWDREVVVITAIDVKYLEMIEEWLLLVEITTTKAPRSLNWKETMKIVRESKATFYDVKDEDGEEKPAGWLFLSGEDDEDDDEEEEEDDEYGSEESESEEESSDSDASSDFTEEDDDSDEYDEEDELSEAGQV